MKPAIEVHNLSKLYQRGERQPYLTLRDSIAAIPSLFRQKTTITDPNDFWALDDVSFSIQPGEVVGLIGRNGAGKSTLLKVLSRITPPTVGSAVIRGRMGSLLEVGTGFHMELSGRENIFLYGAILGMKRVEISQKFAEIVEFAEVGDFLDTPLKHYSSGMYLRLAFAVAAHLETEILLVDEVLAVGDATFQQKSVSKMGEVANQGRTVIFVSHNMSTIAATCKRAILLEKGSVLADGKTDTIVQKYLTQTQGGKHKSDSQIHINSITLATKTKKKTQFVVSGEQTEFEIQYQTDAPIQKPHFILTINHQSHPLISANMLVDQSGPDQLNGTGAVRCTFESLPLLPGIYEVGIRVVGKNRLEALFLTNNFCSFSVLPKETVQRKNQTSASGLLHSGPVVIPYRWTY